MIERSSNLVTHGEGAAGLVPFGDDDDMAAFTRANEPRSCSARPEICS